MSEDRSRLIAICGGIGSGKSVVAKILSCLGYHVYDCDSRAKVLMDKDEEIKRAISRDISDCAVLADGSLDRKHIAEVVFADRARLEALNVIVHGAVRNDICRWAKRHAADGKLFVETAIPRSSGVDLMVDEVWEVTAPEDVRIERVCLRNGLNADQVRQRISAQECERHVRCQVVRKIDNSGEVSVLRRVAELVTL